MGLLNQLHLFIHQNWSQTQLIKNVHRYRSISWEPSAHTWEPKDHGSWLGTSLVQFLHLFPPCALVSLVLDWRSSCWMHRQTDRQTCSVRSSTAQGTASFSLLNYLVLFPGQNSINSESAGWFPVCFLRFWAIHPMPWGEQRASNNGQLAVVGLELFHCSLICWDLEPKEDECHQTHVGSVTFLTLSG